MSVKELKKQELEEEVVVNENETKELVVTVEESKKAKMVKAGKKVLKVLGVAAVGVAGFLIGRGTKSNGDVEYYEDSEVVEGEIVDSDEE